MERITVSKLHVIGSDKYFPVRRFGDQDFPGKEPHPSIQGGIQPFDLGGQVEQGLTGWWIIWGQDFYFGKQTLNIVYH